ncbi:hypothetical protein J1G44_11860 [Cellulomonas sp. zg-ZUI199]|uniref:AMIN-like domain-containing protein n=1 Tax=Cellulomonas wangleii TaxID=2816956 RepID=A0ABX8D7L9_9CELL|nr:hypothetical protein [Cellulomonas wangleii]MBO0925172.1 hypothetical protein [Cellulomonas wangleii]QVI63425.1 hypothetical protein KG103_06000 [Cellulomonas wangleii]
MAAPARRLVVATAVATLVTLTACARDVEPAPSAAPPSVTVTPSAGTAPAPTSTTAPTTAPSPTAQPAVPAEAAFAPPGTELTQDGDAAGYVVTQVRVGEHPGYDRVVYELTGGEGTPGYRVGWVDQAVEDPSGEVRQVDGDAVLQVWLIGTTYPVDGGPQEHAGDVRPDDGDIEQVVRPLTFEGMTQSFVGVDDGLRPFRVTVLQDPVRVVVDVQD